MLTRRDMLCTTARLAAVAALPSCAMPRRVVGDRGAMVNDAQSRLNATRVHRIVEPRSVDDVLAAIRAARREGRAVSVCGGRHSMGGQQFGRDTILLDMRQMNRVVKLDRVKGQLEVESGIEWPELVAYLHETQADQTPQWTIRQKQTGVDRVTIGGSLASNIHGRGLRFPPFISDIESFALIDAGGNLRTCSRRENAELFSLAIGGYGLFGVVTHVTLRLIRRTKVQRVVEVIAVKDLLDRVDERMEQGFVYGDCQYSIDMQSDPPAHPGVFSCYKPVDDVTPLTEGRKGLSPDDWARLYRLARTDKKRAFEIYSNYYLGTSEQVYWSDTHQMSAVFEGYRHAVDHRRGTEMITEVYVHRDALLPLLIRAREDFLRHDVDMTYGTIRFIEKDEESFLAWATEPSVCIVCNLHVVNSPEGRAKAIEDFRRIIDRAIEHGGRYYLTYHRWARREQVERCYPQFAEFLRLKSNYDPSERFQSEWYRHYKRLFG